MISIITQFATKVVIPFEIRKFCEQKKHKWHYGINCSKVEADLL